MSDRPAITLTFQSAHLSDERLQANVEDLLPQLRDMDGVAEVGLVPVAEAPENSKAIGAVVFVEVTIKTSKGQEIIGKAKNSAELEQVVQMAAATLMRLEQG